MVLRDTNLNKTSRYNRSSVVCTKFWPRNASPFYFTYQYIVAVCPPKSGARLLPRRISGAMLPSARTRRSVSSLKKSSLTELSSIPSLLESSVSGSQIASASKSNTWYFVRTQYEIYCRTEQTTVRPEASVKKVKTIHHTPSGRNGKPK